MKRIILLTLIIAALAMYSSGSAVAQQPGRPLNSIAVADIKCEKRVNSSLSTPLTIVVIDELAGMGAYQVIDRANRNKVLDNRGFKASCNGAECAAEMGRLLGVDKVVVGSIDLIGKTYFINLRLINVHTKAVENSVDEQCKCDEEGLISAVRDTTHRLMGQPIPPPTEQQAIMTVPEAIPFIPATPDQQTSAPPNMVYVPAGQFWMGCIDAADNRCMPFEKPYHKVYLNDFYIDRYEVTVGQYAACVQAQNCPNPNTGNACNWGVPGRENHPVNCINWAQAKAYCEWAHERLPTEAEWEKAARGTDGRLYPWGNQDASCSYALMNDNNQLGCGNSSTWPVGSKTDGASPYGAMDMAGNVWEWVSDLYDENYYQNSPNENPTGPSSGVKRIIRGGAFNESGDNLLVSMRVGGDPGIGYANAGFRCAKSPAPESPPPVYMPAPEPAPQIYIFVPAPVSIIYVPVLNFYPLDYYRRRHFPPNHHYPPKPTPPGHHQPPQPNPPGHNQPPQPNPPGHNQPPQPNPPGHNQPPQPNPPGHNQPPQPNPPGHNQPPQPNPPGHSQPPQPTPPSYNHPPKPTPPAHHQPPQPTPPSFNHPPKPTPPGHNQPPQPTPPSYNHPPKPTPPAHNQPPQPTPPSYNHPPKPTPPSHKQPPKPTPPGNNQPPEPTPPEHH